MLAKENKSTMLSFSLFPFFKVLTLDEYNLEIVVLPKKLKCFLLFFFFLFTLLHNFRSVPFNKIIIELVVIWISPLYAMPSHTEFSSIISWFVVHRKQYLPLSHWEIYLYPCQSRNRGWKMITLFHPWSVITKSPTLKVPETWDFIVVFFLDEKHSGSHSDFLIAI